MRIKGLLIATVIAVQSSSFAADEIRKLPNPYAYEGRKIERLAISVRGAGAWAREFPRRLARDLNANGIEVVDATELRATAASDDEMIARVRDAGFENVMFIDIDTAAYVNGALMPSSALKLTVTVKTVDGAFTWSTTYEDHSSAMGRAGKLIKAGSRHVIDTMKRDGLIVGDQ